ncbi:MAG: hypothetical protein ACYTEX_26790 [Planctomycetota bacterium]|jgi:hypothetical protein
MMLQRDRDWIEKHFETLHKEVVKVQVDIAALKTKAGIWGAFGGAIPVLIGIGIYLVTRIQ